MHANQVIEHLYETDSFVNEIPRVLRKDGYAVISTEALSSWHSVFALILGWQPFSLTNISDKKLGLGNPLALHRGELATAVSWRHVRVVLHSWLGGTVRSEWFLC